MSAVNDGVPDVVVRLLTDQEKAEREQGRRAADRVLAALGDADPDALMAAVMGALGLPRHAHAAARSPRVVIFAWVCPPVDLGGCDGSGVDPGGGMCVMCAGVGLLTADDISEPHVFEGRLRPAPRPPAVMRAPCGDCAFRPGSPEDQVAAEHHGNPPVARPGPQTPFFCHHGTHRKAGNVYESPAYVGTLPLGAMICAGWWAVATGGPRPGGPYRELPGADRPEQAPPPPPGAP